MAFANNFTSSVTDFLGKSTSAPTSVGSVSTLHTTAAAIAKNNISTVLIRTAFGNLSSTVARNIIGVTKAADMHAFTLGKMIYNRLNLFTMVYIFIIFFYLDG